MSGLRFLDSICKMNIICPHFLRKCLIICIYEGRSENTFKNVVKTRLRQLIDTKLNTNKH